VIEESFNEFNFSSRGVNRLDIVESLMLAGAVGDKRNWGDHVANILHGYSRGGGDATVKEYYTMREYVKIIDSVIEANEIDEYISENTREVSDGEYDGDQGDEDRSQGNESSEGYVFVEAEDERVETEQNMSPGRYKSIRLKNGNVIPWDGKGTRRTALQPRYEHTLKRVEDDETVSSSSVLQPKNNSNDEAGNRSRYIAGAARASGGNVATQKKANVQKMKSFQSSDLASARARALTVKKRKEEEAENLRKLQNNGWYGATQAGGGGAKVLKKKNRIKEAAGGRGNKHLRKVMGEGRERLRGGGAPKEQQQQQQHQQQQQQQQQQHQQVDDTGATHETGGSMSTKSEWVARKGGVGVADAFLRSETARKYMDLSEEAEWFNSSAEVISEDAALPPPSQKAKKTPLAGWIGDYGGSIKGGFKHSSNKMWEKPSPEESTQQHPVAAAQKQKPPPHPKSPASHRSPTSRSPSSDASSLDFDRIVLKGDSSMSADASSLNKSSSAVTNTMTTTTTTTTLSSGITNDTVSSGDILPISLANANNSSIMGVGGVVGGSSEGSVSSGEVFTREAIERAGAETSSNSSSAKSSPNQK